MAKKKSAKRTARRTTRATSKKAKPRARRALKTARPKARATRKTRAKSSSTASAKKKKTLAAKPKRAARPKAATRRVTRAPASRAAKPAAPTYSPRDRLTAAELRGYRDLLLRKRLELLGDVTTLQDHALSKNRQDASGNLSNMPMHMADVGSDHYEQEFTLGLIESERAILREIDEALERIRDGKYGVCAATGRPIGRARLNATPWTKYCYEYVLEQERSGGRRS